VSCKFQSQGCAYQKSEVRLVKRHEREECNYRPVQCYFCTEVVASTDLLVHVTTAPHHHHCATVTSLGFGLGWNGRSNRQHVLEFQINVHSPPSHQIYTFHKRDGILINWVVVDEGRNFMFWVAYLGPKRGPTRHMFRLLIEDKRTVCKGIDFQSPHCPNHQIKKIEDESSRAGNDESGKYLVDTAREVVGCEVTPQQIRRDRFAVIMSRAKVEKSVEGRINNLLDCSILISPIRHCLCTKQ